MHGPGVEELIEMEFPDAGAQCDRADCRQLGTRTTSAHAMKSHYPRGAVSARYTHAANDARRLSPVHMPAML